MAYIARLVAYAAERFMIGHVHLAQVLGSIGVGAATTQNDGGAVRRQQRFFNDGGDPSGIHIVRWGVPDDVGLQDSLRNTKV